MNLLLNIINKLGFAVDEEKEQIIEVQNHEIGALSGHDNLVTYSFLDGKKITIDKKLNQLIIHVSDSLDIIYKAHTDFDDYKGEKLQSDIVYITLDMHLSNGKSCKLVNYFSQHANFSTNYEPRFEHPNWEPYDLSMEFYRNTKAPDTIYLTYENGNSCRATTLGEGVHDIEGIKYYTDVEFLNPILFSSGLIERNEAEEIKEIIDFGHCFIDDSLTELIKAFLEYDFNKNISPDKIKTLGSLIEQK